MKMVQRHWWHLSGVLRAALFSVVLLSSSFIGTVVYAQQRRLRQKEYPLKSEQREELEKYETLIENTEKLDQEFGSDRMEEIDTFYDLKQFSDEEKIRVLKLAQSVTKYYDNIDWDFQRDKFIEAVKNSQISKRKMSNSYRSSETTVMLSNEESFSDVDGEMEENEVLFSATTSDISQQLSSKKKWRNVDANSSHPLSDSITHHRKRRLSAIDGDVFEEYQYNRGNCPNSGSLGVPCAPENIDNLCNKYDRINGSFSACLEACEPAFCCIHDADPDLNYLAPNCNEDENCDQYSFCYIAWWKLSDTVGPALFLRVEQDDEFYDVDANDIGGEGGRDDTLYVQLLLHHWDDIDVIIEAGTVNGEFNADIIFLDRDYWESDF